jgi:hypothetical protein
MDNESEGVVEASSWRTCRMATCPKGKRQAQKGKVFGPYSTLVYGIHSTEDPA